jgi:hypothetical protein
MYNYHWCWKNELHLNIFDDNRDENISNKNRMLLRREDWYPTISSDSECCHGIPIAQFVLGTKAGKQLC